MRVEAVVEESKIGSWRWLTVRGTRREVFVALGQACRNEIRGVLETGTDLPRLEPFRDSARLAAVRAATRLQFPDQVVELEALAEGAEVSADDLLLVNLRGDLSNEGEGCSDIAIVDSSTRIVAHNEDGAPELEGLCVLATIHVDGQSPVTSVWYPGLLPGMTCWLNGGSIACGVDHIPVQDPGLGAGRHFLARRMQEAADLPQLVTWAETASVAGGYSYTAASPAGAAAVNLEVGPVGSHVQEITGTHVHTNHFVYLDDPQTPDHLTHDRLAKLREIPDGVGADDLLEALTNPGGGIRRDAAGDDPLTTHSSMVFDLQREVVSLFLRGDDTVHTVGFAEFLGERA